MSRTRRSSVSNTLRTARVARERRNSLVPVGENRSSAVLRRHKEREDEKRVRRRTPRSSSAESSPQRRKAKKKKKKKKAKKLNRSTPLPPIVIQRDSSSSGMSPVKDVIIIANGSRVMEADLNTSLSNLGLSLTRPLVRLGTKPLYVAEKNGERSVLKKISLAEERTPYPGVTWFEFCMREPMYMRKLGVHDNIISMSKFHVENDTIIIDMELTPKGDLFTIVSERTPNPLALSESKVRFLLRQILAAVVFMHEQNIAHRDIKLENILYFEKPSKMVKICDLEFACNVETDDIDVLAIMMGSWVSMSPEMVMAWHTFRNLEPIRVDFQRRRDGEDPGFSWDWLKCDVWACGVAMYTALHGAYPFNGVDANGDNNIECMYHDMFAGKMWMEQSLSIECQTVLRAMLQLDPARRPSAKEILGMEWFTSGRRTPNPLGASASLSGSASSL